MKLDRIEAADASLVDLAARQCGELAIGCTDTSGEVTAVIESVRGQLGTLTGLQSVMESLEIDQRQVSDATDEARLHAEQARIRLTDGADTVSRSIADLSSLTKLIDRLGMRITSFASALEQVRRTTEVIDAIARTTNMLALNAAIEAERAGEAGATFAVVAMEVKKLARDTRAATDEVAQTMASLTREAETFVGEVEEGVEQGRAAQKSFAAITGTIGEVTTLVEQLDRQSEDIAQSTNVIHDSICRVGDALDGFADAARANDKHLGASLTRMHALEQQANAMFDTIVRSGFATEDGQMVERAIAERDIFLAKAEAALKSGTVTEAQLFDTNYQLIPGSNPERYDVQANGFADAQWRPELDRVLASSPNVVSTACTDKNGYLPTHTTKYSRTPTGDPVHDAAFCRHRRKFLDDTDTIAKTSTKPFHVAVFRREREGGGYDVVRNVYVPLFIAGKRWGDFEIAYRLD